MTRILLFLVGLTCAFELGAISNHELINNLSSRLRELPEGKGTLIKSFVNHNQSYIYDQALAIIAFTKGNDQQRAKNLLRGLQSLQLDDGSLYFSYYLDGKSPYPEGGDKRFAGAIAWVALAAVHYQHKFKSKDFFDFNHKMLSYMRSQMHFFEIKGTTVGAMSFAPSDIKTTTWREEETAALEHNLDAYAAFAHFAKLNKITKWDSEVRDLKQFIMAMWDKKNSHFWSGADIRSGRINTSEFYLDNQSWSLLALDQDTLKEIDPGKALDLNCEIFYVEHEGIYGFMDSKPVRRPASSQFVWSEGSLGQILAMKKLDKIEKKPTTCKDQTSSDFLSSIKKMKKTDGGIGYSTTTKNPDFTTSSSVAGTAWYYFAANDFNPFHMEDVN